MNSTFADAVGEELAQMRASGGSGYDPIRQAQAFPPDFRVEAGEGQGTVVVDMAFANRHRLEVQVAEVFGVLGGILTTRAHQAASCVPWSAGSRRSLTSLRKFAPLHCR
jgi:hypothetical protein